MNNSSPAFQTATNRRRKPAAGGGPRFDPFDPRHRPEGEQTDPDHCGDCATTCANGQRCNDGTCVCDGTSCPGGCCDDQQSCQRGTSDQACGAGGAACQACGECTTCDGTDCAPQSAVCCGDNAICSNGVCTPCGADQRCRNGACGCDPGFHRCGEQCVAENDVAHCAAACDPCPSSVCSPATCDGATCGRTPIAGCCEKDADCGDDNGCTIDSCDPATHTCRHAPNDGAAGICCSGGCCTAPARARPFCVGGGCIFACDPGFHPCSGQFVRDDDVAQCGVDCVACPAAKPACVDGACVCPSGKTCPGDGCCANAGDVCRADTQTCCAPTTSCPVNACGTIDDGCGRPIECPACTTSCHHCDAVSHTCVPDDDTSGCGGDNVCCGGACVDLQNSNDH